MLCVEKMWKCNKEYLNSIQAAVSEVVSCLDYSSNSQHVNINVAVLDITSNKNNYCSFFCKNVLRPGLEMK